MLVPRNTNSIALSSLIGTPYNYWGDDDGDGQGVNGVTATGSLNLSIVDKFNRAVIRNEVPTMCKAPYKLTLSNTSGRLTTRYGVPNESRFSAGNATYYINPKETPAICFAKTTLGSRGLSAAVWNSGKGFLTQSVTPSSYGLNFPTTGAHNLYFDLDISGVSQALSWSSVSHGGITATMTNSTSTSVRVTLTGPAVTDPNRWLSDNPGRIAAIPSLPQTFELVGRDSRGNAVVKYGFVLKQWFVNRGGVYSTYSSLESWCNSLGYYVPKVKDLTNAICQGNRAGVSYDCRGVVGATPSSDGNYFRRHIGAGFFTEWGDMSYYNRGASFIRGGYWPMKMWTVVDYNFIINPESGSIETYWPDIDRYGLCVYPR